MLRIKLACGILMMGMLGVVTGPAVSQDSGARPVNTGQRSAPQTGSRGSPNTGSRGEPSTGRRDAPSTNRTQQPSTRPESRPSTQPGRAPGGGVRAPGGGVRAPGGGVRAPGGGVRAPGSPGSGGPVESPPGVPGNPGNPGGPDGPGGPGWPGGPGGGNDCDHSNSCRCVWLPGWGWGLWGTTWGRFNRYRIGGVVSGPPQEFEASQPEPEVELTAHEIAIGWMRAGDSAAAVNWFEEHLRQYPNDLFGMREYGLALIDAGRIADGVAMIGYVYDLFPGLANQSMVSDFWGGSSVRLRRSVTSTVRFAQRSPSGNAWLAVAVLMQAEGRDDVALRMIDRAADEGLNPTVADRMRLRLARR